MRLINLTFKRFPADTADAIYVRELSKAFAGILKSEFLLVAGRDSSTELVEIPHHILGFKGKRFRTAYYFFWIPFFVIFRQRWGKRAVFFSNDHFLLSSLIIWRGLLLFQYKICVDWHMILNNWKDRFIAKHGDFHITTTEHLKEQLIKRFAINLFQIKTVYGGVSKENFGDYNQADLRHQLSLPKDKILVGYVGFFKTLGMEKGIKTMIEAIKYLAEKDDLMMVFVGGKTEEIETYEKYAKKHGVFDRCIFKGRVPSDQVDKYQRALDVLVIPYPDKPHFRNYGFPMKTYEYMASGVSVIYSNLPIIAEVLSGYAFSFEPDNPQSLAGVIEEIISQNNQANELSLKANERAKNLTWTHKAREIIDFLKL